MSKTIDPAQRLAALGDLRECLKIAEDIGELEVIEGVDAHLEMGAIYELSLQKQVPPVLLFRKIKGYPDDHRVVCNVRSSRVFNSGVGLELVQNYRKNRRKSADPIPSETVADGPVFENVLMDNQVDVLAFPAPKWHGRRRRPVHRHRMHGDRAGSGFRLGQRRHLPRVGSRCQDRCRYLSSPESTPTPSARNGGRGASIARWW